MYVIIVISYQREFHKSSKCKSQRVCQDNSSNNHSKKYVRVDKNLSQHMHACRMS